MLERRHAQEAERPRKGGLDFCFCCDIDPTRGLRFSHPEVGQRENQKSASRNLTETPLRVAGPKGQFDRRVRDRGEVDAGKKAREEEKGRILLFCINLLSRCARHHSVELSEAGSCRTLEMRHGWCRRCLVHESILR